MNPSEAAIVLATAAAVDRRTVGESDARVWADLLGDTGFDDAVLAVKNHYAMSSDFIYPADVLGGVRAIERTRIDAGPNIHLLEPPAWVTELDGDAHTAALLRWEQESRERIRRGLPVEHGTPPAISTDAAERVRAITEGLAASMTYKPGAKTPGSCGSCGEPFEHLDHGATGRENDHEYVDGRGSDDA